MIRACYTVFYVIILFSLGSVLLMAGSKPETKLPKSGYNDFLEKPVRLGYLLEKIKTYLKIELDLQR